MYFDCDKCVRLWDRYYSKAVERFQVEERIEAARRSGVSSKSVSDMRIGLYAASDKAAVAYMELKAHCGMHSGSQARSHRAGRAKQL